MSITKKLINLNKKTDYGIWVGLALLSIAFGVVYSNFTQDDAFISYRYARNISNGFGFVYNHGEWVLGTTTPLYTLILAAINFITHVDIAKISSIVCTVCLWLSAGFLYELGKSKGKGFSITVAIIYLTFPLFPHFMGMESYFLLFLFNWGVWSYEKGLKFTTSIICGLLVLVRYELSIFLGLLFIFDLIRNKKIPFWLTPGMIPVLFWVIYATVKFGNPIPLSATAKLLASKSPFILGFIAYVYSFIVLNPIWFVVIGLFFIGLISFLFLRKFHSGYALFAVFGIVYLIIAAFIAGSFPWYYSPLVPLLSILTAYGVDFLINLPLFKQFRFNPSIQSKITIFVQVIIISITIFSQLSFWYKDWTKYHGQPFDHRYAAYSEASSWLSKNASNDQSIALLEIGYIGYMTDMKIIDLYGLITSELQPWVGQGSEATLRETLNRFSPDFVLLPLDKSSYHPIIAEDPRYKMVQVFEDQYSLYENLTE